MRTWVLILFLFHLRVLQIKFKWRNYLCESLTVWIISPPYWLVFISLLKKNNLNLLLFFVCLLFTVSSQMTLNSSTYKGFDRAFCIRMKSTLTKRGCHFKSSGYRVSCVPNLFIFIYITFNCLFTMCKWLGCFIFRY